MHVLVVGDFLKSSGMTRYIFNVVGGIEEKNLKIDVLAVAGSKECQDEANERQWGFSVIPAANGSLFKHIVRSYQYFKKNASDFDVIHFNETALWNFLPIVFAYHFGKKRIVLNSHNTYFASNGNKVVLKILELMHEIGKRIISPLVTKKIAVSAEAAKWMFTPAVIKKNKYKVIPNGIVLKKFTFDDSKRQIMRQKLGIEANSRLYGNVGVFNKRKNQLRLLSMFEKILIEDPSAKLLLIGDGPQRAEIIKKMKSLGIDRSIILISFTDHVADYYQAMDAVIMPSINEGLSTVLLEAQTSGLLFFASSQMSLGDYIKELVYPLSLDASDRSWAKNITQHINNMNPRRSYLKDMRLLGYDVKTTSEEIYHIYLEAL
ncbi:hypothetical protein A6F53_09850 [Levilactobacillus brevis]|uniref:glycosyltransferase n=1 Tax=Levilactobacillus brevis TaxID=1580 RepID=UPI0007F8F06D|nr:glycosyltransferase [Levilactobacillus brevis]ANN49528.1 hypothetical protein A6F53_09850 [Levilactobacillus brevis]